MPRANQKCSFPGGCYESPTRNGRCSIHQFERYGKPWERSTPYGKALPESVKRHVRRRSEGYCQICGMPGYEVDHIVPRFKGGLDNLDNLQLLCKKCHSIKSAYEGQEALALKRLEERLARDNSDDVR